MRTRSLAVVAAAVLLTLTGCSAATVTGSASPDLTSQQEYQSKHFDAAITLLDKGFDIKDGLRGTVFKHASFGDRDTDSEFSTYILGNPPAIFIKSSSSIAGDNIDTYHPAGGDFDYLLLGDLYRSLSPTPWAAVGTSYAADPVNVCLLAGPQTVCDIEDAMKGTADDKTVTVVKHYSEDPDGTINLLTGVTLASILEYNFLVAVPDDIKSSFTPEMLKTLLPLHISLDADGNVKLMQINGTVPGATPFLIQVGYQVTGQATTADFPPPPSVLDVTTIADKTAFYDQLAAL